MRHTETPVKVLMIAGLGRSGSTILDLVLGNHPQIESVGEVGNLMRNGWISRESLRGIDPKRLRRPLCTCGRRLDVLYVDTPDEACPFWSGARRKGLPLFILRNLIQRLGARWSHGIRRVASIRLSILRWFVNRPLIRGFDYLVVQRCAVG